jgi:hypothetical protein
MSASCPLTPGLKFDRIGHRRQHARGEMVADHLCVDEHSRLVVRLAFAARIVHQQPRRQPPPVGDADDAAHEDDAVLEVLAQVRIAHRDDRMHRQVVERRPEAVVDVAVPHGDAQLPQDLSRERRHHGARAARLLLEAARGEVGIDLLLVEAEVFGEQDVAEIRLDRHHLAAVGKRLHVHQRRDALEVEQPAHEREIRALHDPVVRALRQHDVDAERTRVRSCERVQHQRIALVPQRERLGERGIRVLVDADQHDVVGDRTRMPVAQHAHLHVERGALGVGERRAVRRRNRRERHDDGGDDGEQQRALQARRQAQPLPEGDDGLDGGRALRSDGGSPGATNVSLTAILSQRQALPAVM